eukprot:1242192-Rhodomonas_salina.1
MNGDFASIDRGRSSINRCSGGIKGGLRPAPWTVSTVPGPPCTPSEEEPASHVTESERDEEGGQAEGRRVREGGR